MSAKRGMTLRAQWLGRQLRELREAAGLKLPEAGDYIQRDGATVSRLETGLYPARTPDVQALLDLYGVADPHKRGDLMKLATEVWHEGWWDGYSGNLSKLIVDYAWVESRARVIRSFDALAIPGLLQTGNYMEAVIRQTDTDPSLAPSGARFRLERQQILAAAEPPRIEAILDEGLLRRPVGGPAGMKEQLERLLDLGRRPAIDIRVLPFASGAHAGHDGSFRIFEMPEPYPQIGYVDSPAGGIYIEAEGVDRLMLKFDRMRSDSPDPSESMKLIRTAINEFESSAEGDHVNPRA
ncbi:helix-turn-helix transcriptional regulator [Sphaerisporangium sp. NPDC051017]|uniref:helix-turn-helix domain-containing protein n=1 Tax=Sphaerisporangium sp. NPDC051017 TaxID=3154636 RepID=UPI00343143F8